MPTIVPSGAALATMSVPILPLAPGLFSITTLCFDFTCSRSAISRMMMSGVAPAANGTTIRTGLVGHSCATAVSVAGSKVIRARPRVFIAKHLDIMRLFAG